MSYNDITGDKLTTKVLSKEGQENFDKIFPRKQKEQYVPPKLSPEVLAELEALKNKHKKV